jgi:GDP-L-fucose synthase
MILVSGSNGLLGTSLRKKLGELEVHYTDSKECDLRDINSVDSLFNRIQPKKVIHLAARVGGVYANLDNNLDFLIDNVRINNNIVEMCRKYNVELLINVLSTCIFPDNVSYPITSSQLHNGLPHKSNIGYAYSKRLLQVASKLLSETTETKVVNLTPTNLFGRNDNYNLINSHVIPALIHNVYNAKNKGSPYLSIKGDGTGIRQFLYVDDLSVIITHFIRNTTCNYNELIVSPPIECEISIKNVIDIITNKLGYTGRILYDSKYSNGQHKKTVDSTEIKKYIPDFQFTDLETGLDNTIKFFCANYDSIRK